MKEIRVITVHEWQVRQMMHDVCICGVILSIFAGVILLCQVLTLPRVIL